MKPAPGRLVRTLVAPCVCLLGAVAVADAASVAHAPLPVKSASLTQDGQRLVWHVVLDHRFSPSAMRKAGRRLCLVFRRARGGSVLGELCVAPPRDKHHPQLVFQRPTASGRGVGRSIAATVTRSSASDLTGTFLPGAAGLSYRSIRWQVLTTLKGSACVPPTADPLGCTAWFPARPALARLHTPRLVGCVASGPPYVSSGSTNRRVIALTFDDGPWPDTPQFLDVLEREHVRATFFQIGEQVGTYGRAVDRRMLADGDMIGDHTWSHPDVAGDGSFAAGQIAATANAIQALTGFRPCLFRAPGGAVSGALISQARSMGFTTIEWDVDPRDWSRPGTGAIYSTVVGNAHPGAIVIQHDGGGDRSETLAALPQEIATLRSRGYQFVTVSELLGQQLIYK